VEHESCDKNQTDQPTGHCFVGPLNLNRDIKQASTVMGAVFDIDASEFDALDMLASNEGQTMTFEWLYMMVWDKGDGRCNRSEARLGISNLMEQVNKAGESFMWVDNHNEEAYTFMTRWGHNWQSGGDTPKAADVREQSAKPQVRNKRKAGMLLAGVTTVAASVAVAFGLAPSRSEQDIHYIFDAPVPLAAVPSFSGSVSFPATENVILSAGSRYMPMELYNPENNIGWLVFEIMMADSRELIYVSEPVAPGEGIENISVRPFETGEHKAILNISAYDIDDHNLLDSVNVDFIIYAN